MTYELAKKLKENGFPFEEKPYRAVYKNDSRVMGMALGIQGEDYFFYPELSELIEACGYEFESLSYIKTGIEHPSNTIYLDKDGRWEAVASDKYGNTIRDTNGHSPEEAVSRLWLELNKK